ncbi:two-component system regulatory protein YycI [Rummeliibacillus sp. NPDC094406]|uniref:two-component system regulatory protein YycI n=1 Tax=Rummeliibacillus sp. NPDC094406 TaxID=3364511 RepID=UPI0038106825
MDWNKTKTIFIIVFSILNVFLYTMYVNKYNEDMKIEFIGETDNISNRLKEENITFKGQTDESENVSYISGKIKQFSQDELSHLQNQHIQIHNGTDLESKIISPTPLTEITDESLTDFVEHNVYKGGSYKLWKINKEEKEAIFFQSSENRMIYYNQNAEIKIHWNDDLEITRYEQKMFDSLKSFGEKYTLNSTEAVKAILANGYLPANSTVTKTQLGYSTLVLLTETQVLSPTWYIHVVLPKDKKGEKKEVDYFVNAVDGTIVDIEQNAKETELKKQ